MNFTSLLGRAIGEAPSDAGNRRILSAGHPRTPLDTLRERPCLAMWSSPGSPGRHNAPVAGLDPWRSGRHEWVHCDAVAPEKIVTIALLEASTSTRQPSADQPTLAMTTRITPEALPLGAQFRRALGEHLITLFEKTLRRTPETRQRLVAFHSYFREPSSAFPFRAL